MGKQIVVTGEGAREGAREKGWRDGALELERGGGLRKKEWKWTEARTS